MLTNQRRCVFYTVSLDEETPPPRRVTIERQLKYSIRSLRELNATIGVRVFGFGRLPQSTEQLLREYNVELVQRGSYCEELVRQCPRYASVLRWYPVTHKWIALQDFIARDETELLYVDNDTVFLSDPEVLFDKYRTADWYARAEVFSSRSYEPYDRNYLDEEQLGRLARDEGCRELPPFNLGVVRLNNRVWDRIGAVFDTFWSNLWRMHLGIVRDRPPTDYSRMRSIVEIAKLDPRPDELAMAYPSSNLWIIEQLALLLTLGRAPDFTHGFLAREDSVQNGEYRMLPIRLSADGEAEPKVANTVVVHYYSDATTRFLAWYDEQRRRSGVDPFDTE